MPHSLVAMDTYEYASFVERGRYGRRKPYFSPSNRTYYSQIKNHKGRQRMECLMNSLRKVFSKRHYLPQSTRWKSLRLHTSQYCDLPRFSFFNDANAPIERKLFVENEHEWLLRRYTRNTRDRRQSSSLLYYQTRFASGS